MDTPKSPLRDWSALAFASFFPVVMSFITFVVLDVTENDGFMKVFRYGKIVQFSFPLLYVLWFERENVRLVWPRWQGFPVALGFAIFVALGMILVYYFAVRHIPSVSEETPTKIFERLKQFNQATPTGYLMMAIFICGPHALMEEYYWRWFVFGMLRRYVPLWPAIVLSSIGFMLHHIVILGVYFPSNFWTLAIPLSLCVAFGGGVWAWLYERNGALYACWLSHCLIDASILALGFWMMWEKFYPPLAA